MRKTGSYKQICTLLSILGLMAIIVLGCSQDDTQQEDTQNNNIGEEETPADEANGITDDETKDSTENVPGTSIPVYPGAQMVHSEDDMIVYSTDATLDDLYDYYIEFPEFSRTHGSRAADYVFFLETEVLTFVRNMGQHISDQEAYEEYVMEMDAHMNESASGRIMLVVGLEEGSQNLEQSLIGLSEENWASVPQDKKALFFGFFTD